MPPRQRAMLMKAIARRWRMANWPITLVADYADLGRELLGHDEAVSSFGDDRLIGFDAVAFDLDQVAVAKASFDRLECGLITVNECDKRSSRWIFCDTCRRDDQTILS